MAYYLVYMHILIGVGFTVAAFKIDENIGASSVVARVLFVILTTLFWPMAIGAALVRFVDQLRAIKKEPKNVD